MRLIQAIQPRPTILLAHDFSLIRSLIRDVLEPDDYHIIEAENGRRAVELASHWDCPDLVIIDYGLHDMNGLEAVRKIRMAGGQSQQVPILIISTYGADLKVAALDAGADAYFGIPEELERMHLTVRDILGEGQPGM